MEHDIDEQIVELQDQSSNHLEIKLTRQQTFTAGDTTAITNNQPMSITNSDLFTSAIPSVATKLVHDKPCVAKPPLDSLTRSKGLLGKMKKAISH